MTIYDARSIDELYQRVSDYDLVLTGEAPLADALNSRLETARLDKLAYTPRGLVYRQETGEDTRDRRALFLKIVRETDLSWKEALYLLENVLDCWQETGHLDAVRDYDSLDRPGLDQVLEILRNTESVFQLLEQFDWSQVPERSAAVLGEYQFKALDRNVLPPSSQYDSIGLLDEDVEHKLSPFLIYPSANNLVESMLEEISVENATDVAIVMEPTSPYQYLVASALEARDIPYMSGHDLTEDLHFRTLFKLMRCAFSARRLKVEDVQPVLKMARQRVSNEVNEQFVADATEDALEEFRGLVGRMDSMTFRDAIESYRDLAGVEKTTNDSLTELEKALKEIDHFRKRISLRHLNRLEFFLNSFEVQVEKQRHGVLLASPKSEAIVDRNIVFHVGLDASWTRYIPENPWVDRDQHRGQNIRDFQVLLQNGQQRYFLVQEKRLNETVTPCFYFNVLFNEEFETFSDRSHELMGGREVIAYRSGETFEREDVGEDAHESIDTISQSTLNKLVRCPREYLTSKMVPDPETVYMRKGNVFHDFTEFYVNHPDRVEGTDEEEIVDVMVEALNPFLDDWQTEETRTEFRVGIRNITEFMENRPPVTNQYSEYSPSYSDNIFSDHFDCSLDSALTEAWFENPDLGAHGKIDLVRSPEELVDYKSGGSGSPRGIVRRSNVELLEEEDDPDFQALMYLAQHRRVNPDRALQFTFFHFLDNLTDRVRGRGVLNDTLVTVTYYPRTFDEHVPREETIEFLRSSNDRRKLFDKLGDDNFRKFFRNHTIEQAYEKDDLVQSELAETFRMLCRDEIGDYKYVTEGCDSILKQLVELRTENYFKEDLDRFETFLADRVDDLNKYMEDGFPVYGVQGDIDLDRVHRRDLVLDDSREA